MDVTTLTREQIDSVLAANSFRYFVERFWHLASSDPFVSGRHIDAICEHLQAVAEGRVKRLAVNVAIRHSKSLLCSVLFPVWLWTRDPSRRIITASYSKDLTVRDAIRSRAIIEHDEFKRHFGHFGLTEDVNRRDLYTNDKGGHRLSVSIGSRTSGFDADIVICDDLHDFATRSSEAERRGAIDYFETALCSRLVYTGREAVVIAGHRVHEDDVYSMLRGKYGDDGTWSWLVLPEEYTDKFSTWFNALNWSDTRADGELLWPERFTTEVIEQQRKAYRHEFSAIFLQEPTPAEGSLFKAEWFRTWTRDADGNTVLDGKAYPAGWRFATVDTAISTESGADWTVCQCWEVVGPNLVLVDQLRKRLDGNRIVPALVEFYRTHRPQFLCVETEFVGRFVLDQLRAADVPVKPFRARGHGTKETRAVAAEIRCEAGRVYFPASAPWVADLTRELLGFPHGAHDDQCFVAGTVVETADGPKAIETIEPGELVLTRKGYRRVLAGGFTGVRQTFTMTTETGLSLTGTGEHPVWTCEGGWTGLKKTDGQTILTIWNSQSLSNTAERHTTATPNPNNVHTASITSGTDRSSVRSNTFTDGYGRTRTARSHAATTSTTETATHSTTTFPTWNASVMPTTSGFTPSGATSTATPNTLNECDTWPRIGTAAKPGGSGTLNTVGPCGRTGPNRNADASCAAACLDHATPAGLVTVPPDVASVRPDRARPGQCSLTPPVLSAVWRSVPRSDDPARCVQLGVRGVSESGWQAVYNLTVDDQHEFFANGILVHNCDALAMACILADKYAGPVEPIISPEEQARREHEEADRRFRELMFQGSPF